MTCFWQVQCSRGDGLQKEGDSHWGALFLSHSLIGLLWGKPDAYCELLYRQAHVARNWCLRPITSKNLRPANSHISEVVSWSSHDRALKYLAIFWILVLWETKPETPSQATPQSSTQRNHEIINICYVKLLSYEVVCYAAIVTNTYSWLSLILHDSAHVLPPQRGLS